MKHKIRKLLPAAGMLGLIFIFALFIGSCDDETQLQLSGNNILTSLEVSEGFLSFAYGLGEHESHFHPYTHYYYVIVANAIENITITAILADTKAYIINPSSIINVPLDLNIGENTFYISVIAENGNSRTYTIKVYREDIQTLNIYDFYITGTGYFNYDGDPKIVNITPIEKITGAITVLYNGLDSEPVNAGEYLVTFNIAALEDYNDEINGLEAGSIVIYKVAGEAVGSPSAAVTGMNNVTLNSITASTGQDVEYSYSYYYNDSLFRDWQTDPVFTGLTAGTEYWFYARSASNNNYEAGTQTHISITTKQQAGINIISYWADYDGTIGIRRQDDEQIAGNTVKITPGDVIVFTPNTSGYSNHKWTLNGVSGGNELEYTFDTEGMETGKNYIIGLYVENEGKPYFTQITVMIQTALTGTVSINGTVMIGSTLTANTSSLGGSGTIFYQWNRSGIAINDANNQTYIVQDDDSEHAITVTVSRSGNIGSVTSMPVYTPLTGMVSITGTAMVRHTLTAITSNLGGSGTITYQWRRGNTNIGSNSSDYTVQSGDVGSTITVTVSRSGGGGSLTSLPTKIVEPYVDIGKFEGRWYRGATQFTFTGNTFVYEDELYVFYRGTFTVTATQITFHVTERRMISNNWITYDGSWPHFVHFIFGGSDTNITVTYSFNDYSSTPLTIGERHYYRN
ncbi:MAG: cadherin-like beta sandwich domain-containing protein [Treponema sp.]|nr:cadherin-like beta sandwich domain-containing protein [Treponema sp.]